MTSQKNLTFALDSSIPILGMKMENNLDFF